MTDYECRKIAKMQSEYLIKALKEDDALLNLMFPPKMMGIQEASIFTGIPVATIYQKISEIPHSKVGKRLVFTDRGLTRWLTNRESVSVNINIKPALRKVM